MQLPNGFTFDETSHIYKLNGLILPSVTTLMRPLSAAVYHGIDKDVLAKAAARGTAVHSGIENFLSFGAMDVPSEYAGFFTSFMAWYRQKQIKIIGLEVAFFHKDLRYSGKADMLAEVDGSIALIDYKTSVTVSDMMGRVQTEAYSNGLESQGQQVDKKIILHLTDGGKPVEHPYRKHDTEAWTTFMNLLSINNYIERNRGK